MRPAQAATVPLHFARQKQYPELVPGRIAFSPGCFQSHSHLRIGRAYRLEIGQRAAPFTKCGVIVGPKAFQLRAKFELSVHSNR
jgi:hypothetical protein